MMRADATVGPGINNIDAKVALSDLFYRTEKGIVALQDVDALIKTNDSTTDMTVTNRDLKAAFHAPVAPDSLVASFGATSGLLAEQLRTYFVDIDTLGHTLPPFTFEVAGGPSNMVNDFLAPSKMSVRALRLNASNDSTLTVDGYVRRLQMESARIDSIYLSARQHHEHLHLAAGMLNKPGNMDEWHDVSLKGVVDGNRMNARLHQENIKGKTGFDIGLRLSAEAADSTFTLNISPTTPTIGYQSWLANDDNFISYRLPDSHIDANLHMHGANSSLAIFTQPPDSLSAGHEQEDLNIQLTDIHIQDWIAFNPFAPPVKGDISADMRLNRANDQLVGKGSASISDFFYGRDKVADFNADFDVAATPSGAIRANTELYV
ncbi:MAG: hypothetical protein K2F79_03165, partial [Muribaculaceae bacterium]|nr:hypothetical protein [Muribaculaceae bacterium]